MTEAPRSGVSRRVAIALAVAALFAGVLAAKYLAPSQADTADAPVAATHSLTSVRNDALADYEAAMATGRPIYVMFHSSS